MIYQFLILKLEPFCRSTWASFNSIWSPFALVLKSFKGLVLFDRIREATQFGSYLFLVSSLISPHPQLCSSFPVLPWQFVEHSTTSLAYTKLFPLPGNSYLLTPPYSGGLISEVTSSRKLFVANPSLPFKFLCNIYSLILALSMEYWDCLVTCL